jgi:hypothetical protein
MVRLLSTLPAGGHLGDTLCLLCRLRQWHPSCHCAAGAIGEYSAALRQDTGDFVAANNLALCSMYGGNLAAGIQSLEAAFLAAPERLLQV